MEILSSYEVLNIINVVFFDNNGLLVFTLLKKDLFALDTKESLHELSESKANRADGYSQAENNSLKTSCTTCLSTTKCL